MAQNNVKEAQTTETKNIWPEMEEVFIPKTDRGDDSQYVSVNGERILVKKGVSVMLPRKFAAAVKNMLRQREISDAYIEATAK